MNKIEDLKAEKDGLDVGADILRYAERGWEAIEEGDIERLKWWGIFFRRHTRGHFMIRIRVPNGISNAALNSGRSAGSQTDAGAGSPTSPPASRYSSAGSRSGTSRRSSTSYARPAS